MAIDTTNKKFSLMTLGEPWLDPLPISSDGLGQADKQHLLALYCGLLANVLNAANITITLDLPDRSLDAELPNRTLSVKHTTTPA